jgi:endonuclease III
MSKYRKLKSVAEYGERYVQEYLSDAKVRHAEITSDPLEALRFWFGKSFMRGRNDTLSTKFKNQAFETLRTYKNLDDIDLSALEGRLAEHGVNNPGDRRMVKESISFARNRLQEYDRNMFNWATALIRTGRADKAYQELTTLYEIGDKLATFYLRDVVLVEDAEDCIDAGGQAYVQPVDTWVRRVAQRLEIVDADRPGNKFSIKRKIISECLASDVSPLLFNAGAWMVGAHGSRLLIERL